MVTSSWKPILEGSRSFLSSGETPAHEQTIESAALVSLSLSLPFMTLFLECRPSAVPFRGFSVSSAFSSVFLFENAISRLAGEKERRVKDNAAKGLKVRGKRRRGQQRKPVKMGKASWPGAREEEF